MSLRSRVLVVIVFVGAGSGIAVLWRDNRRLRAELAAARPAAGAPVADARAVDEPRREASPETRRRRSFNPGALLTRLTSKDGAADAGPPGSDGDGRRDRERRVQRRIRNLLGREPGESEEDYRSRVVPLVVGVLAIPRERAEDKLKDLEDAAGLDDEKRASLKQAVTDTYGELIAQANQSIAAGELTPYRKNTLGILNFVAGATTVAEGLDSRFRAILGENGQAALDATGFDLVEYLAVTAPWETAAVPPPAPSE